MNITFLLALIRNLFILCYITRDDLILRSTLDMDVRIERLRLEILLLQPAPSPQDDLSPRRPLVVGTDWMDPEDRMLRCNQRTGKGFFLFKPVLMFFCTFAQVRNRGPLFCFKQTPVWTTTKQLLQNKPLLVRSLRDHRKSGSSKG